tara:strand:- start:121 stop:783 length:663 start_codon:yes stop_codon:yes gene_type:complete
MWKLPKEVVIKALECCRDIYPHEDDVLINRDIDGYTILAIEGTKEKTDWLTNIKFLLKSDDCHRGFRNNSYRSLAKLVCDYEALDKKRKLVIAGHSLGGATATIIADLILPSNDNIALVTAGSPRPGGRLLRDRLKNVEHLRFVHGNDIVPKTPPWINGFVHTHQPIHLPDAVEGRFDGVADHNIGDYVTAAIKLFTPKGKYTCTNMEDEVKRLRDKENS